MGTLLLRFQQLRNGLPSLNVAVTALKLIHVEDVQKSATPPEIIEQVYYMLLDNGRMKVREIAETICISKECVGYILHEELDMKKLCAGLVPRLLTAD
jgi:predicted DNA-binding transcriptional regulator